jgi:hypothetical protein
MKQMSRVILAMIAMTGRVTMLGIIPLGRDRRQLQKHTAIITACVSKSSSISETLNNIGDWKIL